MVIRAAMWCNIRIVSTPALKVSTNVLTLSAGNEYKILMDH